MKKEKKILFTTTLISLISSSFIYNISNAQVIYKRVNKEGVVVYSDYIPTNSKEKYETYSSKNLNFKKVTERELTQEEYQQVDIAKKQEEELRKTVEEEKRKDQIILSSYNNLGDIDTMKKFDLERLKQSINTDTDSLAQYKDTLTTLQVQLAGANETNKAIVQDNINRVNTTIKTLESNISRSQQLVIEKTKKYDEDEKRLRQILEAKANAAQEELNSSQKPE